MTPTWLVQALAREVGLKGSMDNQNDDKLAIKAVWQQALEALARCDWEAYSSLWIHEDYVQAVHPATCSWWIGWAEVGARYPSILEKGIPIHGRTSRMEVHVAKARNMAWAVMDSEVRTGKTGYRSAWQVVVFERTDDQWRIALAFDAPTRSMKK